MSLNTPQLRTDLKALLVAVRDDQGDGVDALDVFVNALAGRLEDYVKSAQINYTGGLTVGASPVVGTFNGTLS